MAEILEDEWFQIDYEPSIGIGQENLINLDNVDATFDDKVGVRDLISPFVLITIIWCGKKVVVCVLTRIILKINPGKHRRDG